MGESIAAFALNLMLLPTDVATHHQAEWLTYRDEAGQSGVVRFVGRAGLTALKLLKRLKRR
jgi:hypothetical protein